MLSNENLFRIKVLGTIYFIIYISPKFLNMIIIGIFTIILNDTNIILKNKTYFKLN